MMPMSILCLFILFTLCLSTFYYALASAASNDDITHTTPVLPLSQTPLIMLSTMDGTLSAYDARSGAQLFKHQDERPAVDSWAAPGVPDYVPSLDGLLYRIDRNTDDLQVIDTKFISSSNDPAAIPVAKTAGTADAVVLTAEESSVMYIDLRTGKVLQQLRYSDTAPTDPLLPRMADHLIAVSRTMVGVRVVQIGTNRELANASLVHTVPSYVDRGRCPTDATPPSDAFVAYVTKSRNRVTVRSINTGDVLWSKELTSPVVEAHGLGGVRVAGSRREAELAANKPALPDAKIRQALPEANNRDVIVTKQGKYMYAMLAAPDDDDDSERNRSDVTYDDEESVGVSEKSMKRYQVNNVRDPSAIPHYDRLLSVHRRRFKSAPPPGRSTDDANSSSRDAGLALLALIAVGLVGYMAGRQPRSSRNVARRRTRRRRRTNDVAEEADNDDDPVTTQRAVGNPDEDEETETEYDILGEDNDPRQVREYTRTIPDSMLELSTGSTGSSGAGYVSNQIEPGWVSVGRLMVCTGKQLGKGSHGTVVFEGVLHPGERRVAVKRLLRAFFDSAKKEISLLIELDEASPHVVRYFAMEEDSEFIYLALELCAGSLADSVQEKKPPVPPLAYVGGPPPSYTCNALRQLLLGLADLHKAGVVHRDVKPQNVLLTRKPDGGVGDMKLADVGLALRLAANRSSYTAVSNAAGGVGTTGWRAPEVLNGGRQTKAVDIFAAGCVVAYVTTGGHHPFGNSIFSRDGNIVNNNPSLVALEALNLPEATDIVRKMIAADASKRPSALEALEHPFFWTDAKKLCFLVDISDRLYDLRHNFVRYTENLDIYKMATDHCSDWWVQMDMELLSGLGSRGYENTASGLLRVIRNKRNHYSELRSSLREILGPLPEENTHPTYKGSSDGNTVPNRAGGNFLTYFTSRVPHLLMCVYQYAIENPALIDQPHFSRYGLKPDYSKRPSRFIYRSNGISGVDGLPSRFVEPTGRSIDVQPEVASTYANDDDYICSDDEEECDKRMCYRRDELVDIQKLCPTMREEVKRRAIANDILQPTAFNRYKKRLETNSFEEGDFDNVPKPPSDTNNNPSGTDDDDSDQGFQRVPPPRRFIHSGNSGFGPRINPIQSGAPPRPPGFQALRPNGGNGNQHYRRNPNGTPTASPWSGNETRVLDFANIRNRQ